MSEEQRQQINEAIQRVIEAPDVGAARAKFKEAAAIILAMLSVLPGFPPIPGFGSWSYTQQQCDDQIDTLTYNQCLMWAYSSAVYMEEN